MKFINTRLLTENFSEALHFWRDVMQLEPKYTDETMPYAYFDTGNGGIELMSYNGQVEALGGVSPVAMPQGHLAVFVFQVEDVDNTYAQLLERGATALALPQDRPEWGVRTVPIKAHDGYIVEIYTSLPQNAAPTA